MARNFSFSTATQNCAEPYSAGVGRLRLSTSSAARLLPKPCESGQESAFWLAKRGGFETRMLLFPAGYSFHQQDESTLMDPKFQNPPQVPCLPDLSCQLDVRNLDNLWLPQCVVVLTGPRVFHGKHLMLRDLLLPSDLVYRQS